MLNSELNKYYVDCISDYFGGYSDCRDCGGCGNKVAKSKRRRIYPAKNFACGSSAFIGGVVYSSLLRQLPCERLRIFGDGPDLNIQRDNLVCPFRQL